MRDYTQDYTAERDLEIVIDARGHKVWINLDQMCIMRITVPSGIIVIKDDREVFITDEDVYRSQQVNALDEPPEE